VDSCTPCGAVFREGGAPERICRRKVKGAARRLRGTLFGRGEVEALLASASLAEREASTPSSAGSGSIVREVAETAMHGLEALGLVVWLLDG
jgi:hypothetical protein